MVVTAKPAFFPKDLYSNVHRYRMGHNAHSAQQQSRLVCLGSVAVIKTMECYDGHPPIATWTEQHDVDCTSKV
jgi:hypothetical protein